MSIANILVVEDDDDLREAVVETLSSNGFECQSAVNGLQALEVLEQNNQYVNLVLSDVQMPLLDGMNMLEKIQKQCPDIPVLLMTAYGTIDKAVLAMKKGAYDYISKPFESSILLEKVLSLTEKKDIKNTKHKKIIKKTSNTSNKLTVKKLEFILEDPVSKELFDLSAKVAMSDSSVMITGPSGTGKEIISRYIHSLSNRSKEPFVALNCAAIPENMLEAILFGYEKGAFTGAYHASPGKFEQANGGTILLDEVTEMPLVLQAKLLRILQEREVERLGSKKVIPVDVRVIATSNRQLLEEVSDHRFREDLYYRLNVFPIQMKSLKDRKQDILPLALHFIEKYSLNHLDVQLSESARRDLKSYSWPGNIRQLENIIQRALVLTPHGVIESDSLLLEPEKKSSSENSITTMRESCDEMSSIPNDRNLESALSTDLKKREFHLIVTVLKETKGNRKEAADRLGISARTLRHKMAKMRDLGFDFSEILTNI